MSGRGKNYDAARAKVDRETKLPLKDAIELAKDAAYAKFDESFDIAVRLGVDPRHADQMVRGACVLPNGMGKEVRVLVFAKGEKHREAEAAGADFVGADDIVEKIKEGWLDFDKAIATPDMMGSVGKIGRILGPRGLMPNPKVGTVTFDVAQAVTEAKAGKVEFRVDKAGIVHSPIGKKSFDATRLYENALALIDTLLKLKPASAKGTYVRSIAVSTTMGVGVPVDPLEVQTTLRG